MARTRPESVSEWAGLGVRVSATALQTIPIDHW